LKGHHDFFSEQLPARSPMPLTVHSTGAAREHGGEAIGHRHAEIVMAMDAQHDLIDAGDVLA